MHILLTLIAGIGFHLVLGATWTGIIEIRYRIFALAGIALFSGGWFIIRRGCRWKRTPLDVALPLWGVAFALSTLLNLEVWRRISIGLWFVGLYVLIWYLLNDLISNGKLKRHVLIDGLLLAGIPVIITGYREFGQWLRAQPALSRLTLDDLPRIKSTLDNPNPLATAILVIGFLAAGRLFSVRSVWGRAAVGTYIVAAGGILFLTQTRGAWLGAGAGIVAFVVLLSIHHRLNIDRYLPALLVGVGVVALVGITAGRGWALEGRAVIYTAALQLFGEAPIAGHGLYTFGRGLLRLVGVIPTQVPHAQAHNLALNVGAELGVVGLVALAVTIFAIIHALRHNWRDLARNQSASNRGERMLFAGGVAALAGIAGHHVFDVTIMQPAVAVICLVPLVTAATPFVPHTARLGTVRHVLLVALASILLAVGAWEIYVYSRFRSAIDGYFKARDPALAAQHLESVVADDPRVPLYLLTRAYLLYAAGDMPGSERLYRAFCALEPYYATPPNDTQIAILHYLKFSPLLIGNAFWQAQRCP